jgi:hypothetical protein
VGGNIWGKRRLVYCGLGAGASPKSRYSGAAAKFRHWRHVGHRLLRLSQVRRHSRQKRWPQPASTEASLKFSRQMGHVPGGGVLLPRFDEFLCNACGGGPS